MDGLTVAADMSLYFDVIKQIQDQINRITYANDLSERERLSQLKRLEHEISQKFKWARRSVDVTERRWASFKVAETVAEPETSRFARSLESEAEITEESL